MSAPTAHVKGVTYGEQRTNIPLSLFYNLSPTHPLNEPPVCWKEAGCALSAQRGPGATDEGSRVNEEQRQPFD